MKCSGARSHALCKDLFLIPSFSLVSFVSFKRKMGAKKAKSMNYEGPLIFLLQLYDNPRASNAGRPACQLIQLQRPQRHRT